MLAAYLVLSGAFIMFAYTPDPNKALVKFSAGGEAVGDPTMNVSEAAKEAVQAYEEARNYDKPVLQRYKNWMVGYATLNWGWSVSRGEPVVDVIADRAPVTLVYLVPAILLSVFGGVAVGLYAAANPGGLFDRFATAVAYVGFGLPSFWLGVWIPIIAVERLHWYQVFYDTRYGLWTVENLGALAVPMVVVALGMLPVQIRYARTESLEYYHAEFVRTLRANGAGLRDVLRHVLRNALLPLTSLFVAEVLTILFVTVYVVEVVLGIPGLGRAAYSAIEQRDIGLILATTILPVLVGLVGNLLQDIVQVLLDPRIDDE